MPYVPPPDWSTFKMLQRSRKFAIDAERAIEIKRQMAELSDELKQINAELEPLLIAAAGTNVTVSYEDAKLSAVEAKGSRRLSEQKLLELKVKRSVIDACYVTGKPKHYVKISFSKGDGNGGGSDEEGEGEE